MILHETASLFGLQAEKSSSQLLFLALLFMRIKWLIEKLTIDVYLEWEIAQIYFDWAFVLLICINLIFTNDSFKT